MEPSEFDVLKYLREQRNQDEEREHKRRALFVGAALQTVVLLRNQLESGKTTSLSVGSLQKRGNTVVEHFLEHASSEEYELFFRLDKESFRTFLQRFQQLYDETPLSPEDEKVRLSRRRLSAELVLALVVRFLASGTDQDDQVLQFGISNATRYRWLVYGLRLIVQLGPAWTATHCQLDNWHVCANLVSAYQPGLVNCVGFMDGMITETQKAYSDQAKQEAHYAGWKSTDGVKHVFVWRADGTIALFVCNAPGSWHDGALFRTLRPELESALAGTPYWIAADTAFPVGERVVRKRTDQERLYQDLPVETEHDLWSTEQRIGKVRVASEWGNCSLVKEWGVLRKALPIWDTDFRQLVYLSCVYMHNYRVRTMGVTQITQLFETSNI